MKVVWTELATAQLKEVYLYYKEVASTKVASTIKSRIYEKTRKLSEFPELGQKENNLLIEALNYRYLVSGNYKIVYRIILTEKIVLIAAIFDTRQNPDDLKIY